MTKRRGLKLLTVLLFISGMRLTIAQTVDFKADHEQKPIVYERLALELSAGFGFSKLQSRPSSSNIHTLLSPFSDVTLTIPLSPKWQFRTGLSYQVIGSSSVYYDKAGNGTANRRLDYIVVHAGFSYPLSQVASRIKTELIGEFFGSKQLQDLTVNRLPNQPTVRIPSVNSSIGYNYGMTLGLSVGTLIHQHNRVGLRALYQQGLLDIRTQTAKNVTGERPSITQAFTFCFYFTI